MAYDYVAYLIGGIIGGLGSDIYRKLKEIYKNRVKPKVIKYVRIDLKVP